MRGCANLSCTARMRLLRLAKLDALPLARRSSGEEPRLFLDRRRLLAFQARDPDVHLLSWDRIVEGILVGFMCGVLRVPVTDASGFLFRQLAATAECI